MADSLERSYIRAASSLLSDAARFTEGIPLPTLQVVRFEASRMAHGPQIVEAPAEVLKQMMRPENRYVNSSFENCVEQHLKVGLLKRDESPRFVATNNERYRWKLVQPLPFKRWRMPVR